MVAHDQDAVGQAYHLRYVARDRENRLAVGCLYVELAEGSKDRRVLSRAPS